MQSSTGPTTRSMSRCDMPRHEASSRHLDAIAGISSLLAIRPTTCRFSQSVRKSVTFADIDVPRFSSKTPYALVTDHPRSSRWKALGLGRLFRRRFRFLASRAATAARCVAGGPLRLVRRPLVGLGRGPPCPVHARQSRRGEHHARRLRPAGRTVVRQLELGHRAQRGEGPAIRTIVVVDRHVGSLRKKKPAGCCMPAGEYSHIEIICRVPAASGSSRR